jgi:hypothetical protein
MEYVCIRSQFEYVKNRVERNNFGGASHQLMGKLRMLLEEFRNVSFVRTFAIKVMFIHNFSAG